MKVLRKKYLVDRLSSEKGNEVFDTYEQAYTYVTEQPIGERFFILPVYELVDYNDLKFRLSVCLCVYQKPERTKRMIDCLMAQTEKGWEAFIYGDGCPAFQRLIDSGYFEPLIRKATEDGNLLHVGNLEKNYGGFGYEVRNRFKNNFKGDYVLFLDNDDMIDKQHFSKYLKGIEGSNLDFMAYSSWIEPISWQRDTAIEEGKIGFSELIIRGAFFKSMPDIQPMYSHDWLLVQQMVAASSKYKIDKEPPYTYIVKSLPDNREKGID